MQYRIKQENPDRFFGMFRRVHDFFPFCSLDAPVPELNDESVATSAAKAGDFLLKLGTWFAFRS